MGETGILPPDARVELIEGEIIDMAPVGSLHAGSVELIAERLRAATATSAMVRTQQPIALDEYSEPEPDIGVVVPRGDHYRSSHPTASDVLLLVEVANASLRYDRGVKASLYAKHGIRELWIVDLERRAIARYRNPRDGIYTTTDNAALDLPIPLTALAGIAVDLSSLFAT
jgi:Uma2 family endonuclease